MSEYLALFRSLFPEFSSVDDDLILAYMAQAAIQVVEGDWGAWYPYGLVYLTAHLLVPSSGVGGSSPTASGSVTQRSVGEVSVSFGSPSNNPGSASDYESTSYGRRFLELSGFVGHHALVTD